MSAARYEVREVLAGAYRGRAVEDRKLLTHYLVPGDTRTLCRRVMEERLCDVDKAAADAGAELATCPVCLDRAAKAARKAGKTP